MHLFSLSGAALCCLEGRQSVYVILTFGRTAGAGHLQIKIFFMGVVGHAVKEEIRGVAMYAGYESCFFLKYAYEEIAYIIEVRKELQII